MNDSEESTKIHVNQNGNIIAAQLMKVATNTAGQEMQARSLTTAALVAEVRIALQKDPLQTTPSSGIILPSDAPKPIIPPTPVERIGNSLRQITTLSGQTQEQTLAAFENQLLERAQGPARPAVPQRPSLR